MWFFVYSHPLFTESTWLHYTRSLLLLALAVTPIACSYSEQDDESADLPRTGCERFIKLRTQTYTTANFTDHSVWLLPKWFYPQLYRYFLIEWRFFILRLCVCVCVCVCDSIYDFVD